MLRFTTALAALWLLPVLATGYPGGTPAFVTDVAPFCSSCHSSVSAGQLEGVPQQRVNAELAANKHIAKVEAGREGTPYANLTLEQRTALIEGIRSIDASSSVTLVAPQTVKAGQVIEVTIQATGGGGPAVGLGLVDSNQRWQASPAPSRGWQILEKPLVTGPDGNPQTDFTDRRNPNLAPGTSYVNVYGVAADPTQGKYDSVSVTFRLRAPARPGTYPLAAVFWYGTEKASPNGAVETIQGRLPVGSFAGNSGRIRFSDVLQIQVQ